MSRPSPKLCPSPKTSPPSDYSPGGMEGRGAAVPQCRGPGEGGARWYQLQIGLPPARINGCGRRCALAQPAHAPGLAAPHARARSVKDGVGGWSCTPVRVTRQARAGGLTNGGGVGSKLRLPPVGPPMGPLPMRSRMLSPSFPDWPPCWGPTCEEDSSCFQTSMGWLKNGDSWMTYSWAVVG